MTLHDAMVELLLDARQPLNARDLSEQINTRAIYRKRDGSPVQPDQVRARARKYPHLFTQAAGAISLACRVDDRQVRPTVPSPRSDVPARDLSAQPSAFTTGSSMLTAALLDPTAFRPAGKIDLIVPNRPGLYAIRVRDANALLEPFRSHSEKRGHDLLYIGIARQSLSIRFLSQELRARGHGTFFRSIGAVLGYRPLAGSLIGKGNTRNYTFSPVDNQAIIDWINTNLLANWVEFSGAHAVEESALIREHLPLLNLQGNPAALPELSILRAECVRIANHATG